MPDIVERLRKENSMPPYYGVPNVQADAADEIERLRAALKAITEVPSDWGNEVYEMLEIARAALEGE